MGRKTIARSLFETFFFCFLFFLLPAHAETEYKPVKGEITGINEKTIQIDTDEPLKPGEKISLVRDGKTTAVCEVVKIGFGVRSCNLTFIHNERTTAALARAAPHSMQAPAESVIM